MRIMTFNIQHCRNFITKKIDTDAIADTIAKLGADVVCLNEVYGRGIGTGFTAQAKSIANKLGFHYFFSPAIRIVGCGPYGNALISRYPILKARTVKVPTVPRSHPGYFEDRAAFNAQIDVEGKTVTVIGIHFGLQPEEQEQCTKTVCKLIDRADTPVVLMGDFNVTPEDKVLLPIRERLFDTAQLPGGNAMTFPSDKPNEKIDYIFVSESLPVRSVDVPDLIVSDHLPIIADC